MSCKYSNYWCLNIKTMVHKTLLHKLKDAETIFTYISCKISEKTKMLTYKLKKLEMSFILKNKKVGTFKTSEEQIKAGSKNTVRDMRKLTFKV